MSFLGRIGGLLPTPSRIRCKGVIFLLSSIPWRLVLWAGAGLCALYFLGWEAFGPPRRARAWLMNGVGAMAAVAVWNGVVGAGEWRVLVSPALLVSSVALGIPGAALTGVLQRML